MAQVGDENLRSEVAIGLKLKPDENAVPELNEEMVDAFNRWTDEAATEFGVELLRRARAVVPFGPGAVGKGSRKDGLSHPGALQRSGRISDRESGQGRASKEVAFTTPYARYIHGGVTKNKALLKWTKSSRQANYLYDAGFAVGRKAPLEIMLDEDSHLDIDPLEGMKAA